MPLYNFTCNKCSIKKSLIIKLSEFDPKEEVDCSDCDGNLVFCLPKTVNSVTMELKDKYRGVHLRKGHQDQLKERMHKHMDETGEYQKRIEEHGMDEGIRHGWVKKGKL